MTRCVQVAGILASNPLAADGSAQKTDTVRARTAGRARPWTENELTMLADAAGSGQRN